MSDPHTSPIRQMFAAIAPRYDFLNRLFSLGMDQAWRKALARETAAALRACPPELPEGKRRRVLDLATGTGDVAVALDRRLPAGWKVVGADITPPMLALAGQKFAKKGTRPISLVAADGQALPFAAGSFSAATIAFGLRNIPDRKRALQELARVLEPGGRLLVLEFSPETAPLFGPLFRFYFQRVMPLLGGLISGNLSAYRYLPASVDRFPAPAALAREMEMAGFREVRVRSFSLGVARLHAGRIPGAGARP